MSLHVLGLLALAALDAVAILRAITRGRGVEGTLAWIFAILAFPGFGALAYLLMANPSVRRMTRRKRLSAEGLRRRLESACALPSTCPGPAVPVLTLAARATGLPPTAGNRVDLLTEDERAFEAIEASVRGAARSVWAEYFIIRNDETGHRFLDLLAERARDGVEVRLLYDAVGSLGLDAGKLAVLRAAGGQVEAFLPVNPLRRRWSVHLRNHRKLVVVDGKEAFTGGMNVGDEYSGRGRRKGLRHYLDSHLAIRGPAAGDLARVFAEDWAFATGTVPSEPPPAAPAGDSVVGVVPSGPDQQPNANALVCFAGVASARSRCYLTSPYFIPDEALLRALTAAAMSGVDVRLLLPRHPDIALVGPAARSYFRPLLGAGVRVFEYRRSMLHAKTLVVDGAWGMVGSANVDIRSFRLNFEAGALVADPAFAAALEARFLKDLESSQEVTAAALSRKGKGRRLWEATARLLSPLL